MNRYEFQVKLLRLLAGELSPDEIAELETQAAHHPRYAGELSALRGLDSLAGTAFRHIDTHEDFTSHVLLRLDETGTRPDAVIGAADADADAWQAPKIPVSKARQRARGRARPRPPSLSRSRAAVALAAGSVVVAVALGGVFLWPNSPGNPDNAAPLHKTASGVGRVPFLEPDGRLQVLRGRGSRESWLPLRPGDRLRADDRVRAKPSGPGRFDLGAGAITARVELNQNALLRLLANDRVRVESGAVYFTVTPRIEGARPFVVELPDGRIEVVGTEFEVEVKSNRGVVIVTQGRVRLYSGGVDDAGGAGVEGRTGQEIAAGQRGQFSGDDIIVAAADGPVAPWRGRTALASTGGDLFHSNLGAPLTLTGTKPTAPAAELRQPSGPDVPWNRQQYEGSLDNLLPEMARRLGDGAPLDIGYAPGANEQQAAEIQNRASERVSLPTRGLSNLQALKWIARAAGLEVFQSFADGKLTGYEIGLHREKTPAELLAETEIETARGAAWRLMLYKRLRRPVLMPLRENATRTDLAAAVRDLARAADVNIYLDRDLPLQNVTVPVPVPAGKRALASHLKHLAAQVGQETKAVMLDGAVFITSHDRALEHRRVVRTYQLPEFAPEHDPQPDQKLEQDALPAAMQWLAALARGRLGAAIGPHDVIGQRVRFAATPEAHDAYIGEMIRGLRSLTPLGYVDPDLAQLQAFLENARRPVGLRLDDRNSIQDIFRLFQEASGGRFQLSLVPPEREWPRVRFHSSRMSWEHVIFWLARFTGSDVQLHATGVLLVPAGKQDRPFETASFDIAALAEKLRSARDARDALVPLLRRRLQAFPRTGQGPLEMALLGERLLVFGGPVARAAVSRALVQWAKQDAPPQSFPLPDWYTETEQALDAPQDFDRPVSLANISRIFVPVVLDPMAPRPAEAIYLHLNGRSIRDALDNALHPIGLTYRLEHGAVYVLKK